MHVKNFCTSISFGVKIKAHKLKDSQMELKITVEEAKQILLKWAQDQFPAGEFNSVGHETYSYSKTFTFTKEEPTNAAQ